MSRGEQYRLITLLCQKQCKKKELELFSVVVF